MVETLEQATIGDVGRALWMFLGAVGLMLLIACANVGNLFLVRATEREGEMAVRAALGAGRGRLLSQILTEGVVLGLAGGVLGVVLAALGVRGFQALDPGGIPRVSEIAVDARVLAFAVALSALTGVLFGLVPAWTSARADAAAALRESGRRATVGRAHSKLRNGLLVAELGLALVLLSGAGVLFNGFVRLRSVDPGIDPERLLTVGLDVEAAVPTGQRMAFVDGVLERIGRGPGVIAAGASWRLPFEQSLGTPDPAALKPIPTSRCFSGSRAWRRTAPRKRSSAKLQSCSTRWGRPKPCGGWGHAPVTLSRARCYATRGGTSPRRVRYPSSVSPLRSRRPANW